MRKRIAQEARDFFELLLIPGIAMVLPWSVCFILFKRLARYSWLYREPCDLALARARAHGWAGENEQHWIWVRRLVTLVDHADHYLGLTRGDVWMNRHLTVEGVWPSGESPALLATFHWGAGYWGLRSAAASGVHPHALVASLETPVYENRSVLTWYARSRNRNVARTLRAETIDIAKNLRKVVRVLRSRQPLLGVLDVPAESAQTGTTVTILGRPAVVAKGLLRLAVDEQVPITYYITGIDTETGQRYLRIEEVPAYKSIEELAQSLFARLDQIIQTEAPAWHFWSIADRFFRPADCASCEDFQ